MKEIHFLVPPEVIGKLSQRFVLTHKFGFHGYFGTITDNEFWSIVHSLVNNNYRVDINPGVVTTLTARKETK